jgi:NAD/NADP transhydrogenase alpha subunit
MNLFSWFKTKKQLIKENERLSQVVDTIRKLADGMSNTIRYQAGEFASLQQEVYILLGAAALQHNGELVIKDEFLKMIGSPEYGIKTVVEKSQESVIIRVEELTIAPESENEEDEQVSDNSV